MRSNITIVACWTIHSISGVNVIIRSTSFAKRYLTQSSGKKDGIGMATKRLQSAVYAGFKTR